MSLEIQKKLEKIALLEAKQKMREGLPHLYGWKWYKWAREFFESRNRLCFLTAANQISKAVWVEELIPTPSGLKRFGDLRVGDEVFAQDGSVTKVIDIPYFGEDYCYRFVFHDGSSVVTSKDHEWVTKNGERRFRKIFKKGDKVWENPNYDVWDIVSTSTIVNEQNRLAKSARNRYSFPVAEPVRLNKKDLPIDPYLLGLILGDGSLKTSQVTVTSSDEEIINILVGFGGRFYNSKRNVTTKSKCCVLPSEYRQKLNELGLTKDVGSFEKFIPEIYLTADFDSRLELLKGLMDTDGSITKTFNVSYSTISPRLKDDFVRLAASLGMMVEVNKYKAGYKSDGKYIECSDYYRIVVKSLINPFKLSRKADRFKITRYKHERVLYKIEELGKLPCMCITVEHHSGTFLITKDHLVTHNSSTQIRKVIEFAGNTDLHKILWRTRPKMFWYFYPSLDVATAEFQHKWVPEFMPRGEYKNHPTYGWEEEYERRLIKAVHFKSGVSIYFKSYEQSVSNLQTSSIYYIAIDEELPVDMWDELQLRTQAVDGYISMVFTATLGQDYWRRVMELRGTPAEELKHADKWQVSMFDCMYYEDGTPSHWTKEKINNVMALCSTKNEILKRVYGRFVSDEGLKYSSYDPIKNRKKGGEIPVGWNIFAGVDPGGGGIGHPAAICFIAVDPNYTRARVVKLWRGDGIVTTASDVYLKYREMREEIERVTNRKVSRKFYDFAAKDFAIIAERFDDSFERADKSHDLGEDILNGLFKNGMLTIDDECGPEGDKLSVELSTVRKNVPKNRLKDDLTDALRYAVTKLPWDWSVIASDGTDVDKKDIKSKAIGGVDILYREGKITSEEYMENKSGGDEFEEWNELY
jgi:phage terminase large subunit-like protein